MFGPIDLETLEPAALPTLLALWGPVRLHVESRGLCPAHGVGFGPGAGTRASGDGCGASALGQQRPSQALVAGRKATCCCAGSSGGAGRAGTLPDPTALSQAGLVGAAGCRAGGAAASVELWAPLHARYPAPAPRAVGRAWAALAGAPVAYALPAPLVLARCGGGSQTTRAGPPGDTGPGLPGQDLGACQAGNGSGGERACQVGDGRWEAVTADAAGGGGGAAVEWVVPSGNPAHEGFVAAATSAAFLLASALVVRAACLQ